MPDSQLVNPHGGALVDCTAPESEVPELNRIAGEAPHLPVDLFTTMDALNIAVGAFSPLRGFLGEADFRAVCERKQLASGLTWTVPVLLHVPSSMAKRLKPDIQLALVDREAVPFALLRVESVFTVAKSQYAQAVFGTTDAAHPGVDRLAAQSDTCVGGTLTLLRARPCFTPSCGRILAAPTSSSAATTPGWGTTTAYTTAIGSSTPSRISRSRPCVSPARTTASGARR